MNVNAKAGKRGFTLIELVIVVVIIGIIGAIAIPRLSRGSEGANDAKLKGDLAVLRQAIDMYTVEHGAPPTAADIVDQLTLYSDINGATNATKDGTHIYGPYIRKIPALSVGSLKGQSGIHTGALGTAGNGWQYNATTGEIKANLVDGEEDITETPYNTY